MEAVLKNDYHSYSMTAHAPPLTLADLKPGKRVRIDAISAIDGSIERLMVMGLVEGAEVEYVRSAIGGDPLEIRVHGAAVSLRREQARCFKVVPVDADG
jgi:Fe2+ transport system protein FeoA